MTIGGSIFLITVGAILYFATNWHFAHIDIDIIGLILMIAGLAGLILGFASTAASTVNAVGKRRFFPSSSGAGASPDVPPPAMGSGGDEGAVIGSSLASMQP
jgi:hypothetical protein